MDLKETLAMLSGRLVREHATRNYGLEELTPALSVVVPEPQAKELVRKVRAALPAGFVCFVGTTTWVGDEQAECESEVVVAPGATQLDILRVAGTEASDYDLTTEDLVARLQKWEAAYGIDLWHAETDTLELDLTRQPQDLAAFAAELQEFCPDSVEQIAGSVEALAGAIAASGAVYLWWD